MTQVSLGRKVHYTLSDSDVAAIDHLIPQSYDGPVQRRHVHAGQTFAADVVAVASKPSPDNVANLQVQLDGNCCYWAPTRREGPPGVQGTWAWPLRS